MWNMPSDLSNVSAFCQNDTATEEKDFHLDFLCLLVSVTLICLFNFARYLFFSLENIVKVRAVILTFQHKLMFSAENRTIYIGFYLFQFRMLIDFPDKFTDVC